MENNNPSPTINLVLEPKSQAGNFRIFTLRSIGANIKRKVGTSERTVWATLDVPLDNAIYYAHPLVDSTELPPANTIAKADLSVMVLEIVHTLEKTLDDAEKTGDSW